MTTAQKTPQKMELKRNFDCRCSGGLVEGKKEILGWCKNKGRLGEDGEGLDRWGRLFSQGERPWSIRRRKKRRRILAHTD